jgi:anaerobic ribonucleoside-triphosphate reductase
MKLYTEEQIRQAFRNGFLYAKFNEINENQFIDYFLVPIELPNNEEIKEMSKPYIEHINTMVHADLERDGYLGVGFIAGAKYVIDKIQGRQ